MIACRCAVCHSDDPRDHRLRSSLLIEHEGKHIVIDAGPDFRQQVVRAGLRHLDAILLTHEHTDHIFGLDDLRGFNNRQKKIPDIYAELRVQLSVKRVFNYAFSHYQHPGVPRMNLVTIENKPFTVDHVHVIPIRGKHYKLPVFGFRIGDMAYLTDINHLEEDEKLKLRGLKVLVVTALRREPHISHMNLEGALRLIEELSPQTGYLTHISHHLGKYTDMEQELPAHIHLAYDGLALEL